MKFSAFVFDPQDVCESTFIMFKREAMESFGLLIWLIVNVNLEFRIIPRIIIVFLSLI